MQINPYLTFAGTCEEAFKFYETLLGGKITAMMTHADTPATGHTPAEWQGKIMHATLSAGGTVLMGSDAMPQHYSEPKGFSVSLNVAKADDAERIFHGLAEGGKVRMALQETFWAQRFGMLTDRFGIPWMLNCEKHS